MKTFFEIMSPLNHFHTPKKIFQLSVPRISSSCRLCGAVGTDPGPNIFLQREFGTLLAASKISTAIPHTLTKSAQMPVVRKLIWTFLQQI